MSNINKFDEYAGRVFGILYESFPIPVSLNIGDILGIPDLYNDSGIPPEMNYEANIAFFSVIWLADTGYLKMPTKGSDQFYDLTLTAKGLNALKAVPDSLTTKPLPLGEQIVEVVKSGAKETLRSLVNEVISVGVKIAIRAANF